MVVLQVSWFKSVLKGSGLRVQGYRGEEGGSSIPSSVDIAVCTIEKALKLVNNIVETDTFDKLAIVVRTFP
jgi:hypothetical protein